MSLAGSAPLQSGQSAQANPVPTLAAPFEPVASGDATPRIVEDGDADEKKKSKKRGIFGFGKKKDEQQQSLSSKSPPARGGQSGSTPTLESRDIPVRKTVSPIPTDHMLPSSPGRAALSSSLSSPAGSQIFERDVQESAVQLPNSPAIPSHITTENHIPPVLDASSEAITDNHLDPDSVEIITHTGHQPAAVTVTGVSSPYDSAAPSWAEELAFLADKDDNASNYGSLDTTDVRRLSFISFADVVQAEQQTGHAGVAGSRDSVHLAGLTSLPLAANRSPSPIRSPISSQGPGTSPPTSKSGSIKGLELSPTRKPLGSPGLSGHSQHGSQAVVSGELAIETMSQALRRTGSGDLSGVRSLPTSPVDGPSRLGCGEGGGGRRKKSWAEA